MKDENARESFKERKKRMAEDAAKKHPKPNLLERVASYGKSELSRGITNKRCSDETKTLRIVSCHGAPELGIGPCPARAKSEKYEQSFYCTECGCGDKKKAQLVNLRLPDGGFAYSKLDYPRVVCPRHMPGFSDYQKNSDENWEARKKAIELRFGVEYIEEHSKYKGTAKKHEYDNNNETNKDDSGDSQELRDDQPKPPDQAG